MSAILSWMRVGGGARPNVLLKAVIPLLVAASIAAASVFLLANPREPVWDQQALLEASFQAPHWPSPARGFTSELVVAIHRAVWPGDVAAQNAGLRVVAMALYIAAAGLLAGLHLRRRSLVALFLVFVFTSQYPFLWLSSELLTGAFLMFAIAAWAAGASPWLVGGALALLGLCKPDVILTAVALLGYWLYRRSSREEGAALAAGFAIAIVALLLPGTLSAGWGYFQTYGGSGGRSFASFSQHYAAMIAHLQITGPPPNPWTETAAYMRPHFADSSGMLDIVLGHFPRYVEFVALSIVRGLFRAGYVLQYVLLAVPCLVWGWRRCGFSPTEREKTLLLSFVGLVPFVLFAYPHVRYLARYYPIFLLLVLMALERVLAAPDSAARRPVLLAAVPCLAVALLENLRRLLIGLGNASDATLYWFPD